MPPPSAAPSPLLPVETIIELLPATFQGWPFCQPSQAPTAASVARIEEELAVRLPSLLLRVARSNASYGYWFNSVGEDYSNTNHILSVNADLRAHGAFGRYVVFAKGFDGECDAWDLGDPVAGQEPPIVSFHFIEEDVMTGLVRRFDDFHGFMDALCRRYAPQCPIDELRHAALQRLHNTGGSPAT